ncbi:MAG: HlyC/CorC family transporter [Phycisphaerae bacterium]|nr:HlyC/CorC family transporter [Phycisphaerae bacterium]
MWELLAENILRLITLTLLIGGSAFFSGTETALFNLSRHQLKNAHSSANPFLRLASHLMKRPEGTLVTVLLGNMTVNVLFFAIASVLVMRVSHTLPGWQSTLVGFVPLLAIIFLGEVLPKIIAVTYPLAFASVVAGPIYVFDRVLWPVREFLQRLLITPGIRLLSPADHAPQPVGPDELQELLLHSTAQGAIAPDERSLLHEVVELGSIQAGEIAVPRVDMVICDIAESREALLDLVRRTGYKRIPAYRDDPGNVVGVLRARDVLVRPDESLEDVLQPAWFIPEIKTVDSLLHDFRTTGRQTALTVDEYGGVTGLVTLEDVVEEVVGEILEPGEAAPDLVRQIDDDTYLLSGRLSVREWAEIFGQRIAAQSVNTIGGMIAARLGRFARVGDQLTLRNLRFVVTRMQRHRIVEVRLERLSRIPDAGEVQPHDR